MTGLNLNLGPARDSGAQVLADVTDAAVDGSIMRRIQQKQRAAFAELYDRYAAVVLAAATRILQNRRDAEDLLHDVFLEVWQNAASYDPERGSVRTWLQVKVRSRAIDRLRSLQLMRNHAMAECAAEPEPAMSNDHDPSFAPDFSCVRKALGKLPQAQRVVLELGYFEGLTCREIAERCSIPIGTVKSRMAAGMIQLRQHLNPMEGR